MEPWRRLGVVPVDPLIGGPFDLFPSGERSHLGVVDLLACKQPNSGLHEPVIVGITDGANRPGSAFALNQCTQLRAGVLKAGIRVVDDAHCTKLRVVAVLNAQGLAQRIQDENQTVWSVTPCIQGSCGSRRR